MSQQNGGNESSTRAQHFSGLYFGGQNERECITQYMSSPCLREAFSLIKSRNVVFGDIVHVFHDARNILKTLRQIIEYRYDALSLYASIASAIHDVS